MIHSVSFRAMGTAKHDKLKIAEVLRALREEDGMSQYEYADMLGLSQATLSRMESGQAFKALAFLLLVAFLESRGGIKAVKHVGQMSGKVLKKEREKLGLSQRGLAARLGVRQASISRWESGEVEISSYIWLGLALAQLKVEMDEEKTVRENAA